MPEIDPQRTTLREALTLKLQHRLTFYHFRGRLYKDIQRKLKFLPEPKTPYLLTMCSCGWKEWMWRKLKWATRFRWLVLCSWRGCNWEAEHPVEVGPVYQDEETGEYKSAIDEGLEDPYILSYHKQCARCYRIKSRSPDV